MGASDAYQEPISAEAERNVESGFTHGRHLVVGRAKNERCVLSRTPMGHCHFDVAHFNTCLLPGRHRLAPALFQKVVIGCSDETMEIACHVAIEAAFVLQAFGGRTVAKIVVTG